jgi:excinuclease UvrABC ATPase subunit
MCIVKNARENVITGKLLKFVTKGKSIADVLDMTVDDAVEFFQAVALDVQKD